MQHIWISIGFENCVLRADVKLLFLLHDEHVMATLFCETGFARISNKFKWPSLVGLVWQSDTDNLAHQVSMTNFSVKSNIWYGVRGMTFHFLIHALEACSRDADICTFFRSVMRNEFRPWCLLSDFTYQYDNMNVRSKVICLGLDWCVLSEKMMIWKWRSVSRDVKRSLFLGLL